jgi:outer membrane protein assembly factor BamB
LGNGATVAIDPHTGKRAWTFTQYDFTDAAVLTTATDLLFTGGRDGYFSAFDARTGKLLWKTSLGGPIYGSITYALDGKQYVSVISGNILSTFALRE